MKAPRKKSGKRPPKPAKPLRATAAFTVSEPARPGPDPEELDVEIVPFTLRLRASLRDLIHSEAHARKITMRSLVLLGLRELGLPVTEDDLQDRRKPGARGDQPAARSGNRRGRRHDAAPQGGNSCDRRQAPVSRSPDISQVQELLLELFGPQTGNVAWAPNIVVINTACRGA